MVQQQSYCVLDRQEHVETRDGEQSLDSGANEKRVVCLPGPLRGISSIPEHNDFIQMLINAKTFAQLDSKPVDITWRDYTLSISSDFILSKENVTKELITALQSLITLTEIEDKVNINIF